jgi:hypothetical protein
MKHRTGICSVCSRSDASDIDHALAVSGASWRSVARNYGLGRSAVNRHAHDHLGARLKKAAEQRAAGSDPALLDKVLEINRVNRGVLGEAIRGRDWNASAALIGRAQRGLELEGRLLGLLRDQGGTTVNVTLDAAAAERMAEIYLARRRGLPPASPVIETTLLSVLPSDRPNEPEGGAPAPAASQEPE